MTELLHNVETPSDAELISRVRGGDVAAYGDLFSRHVGAANRLARQLVRGSDADDLVSEAFAKVLTVLQGGRGPDVAFRAYLLTAVRRLHVDRLRAGSRLQTTDDLTAFDPGIPFQDTAVAGFESGAAAKAFASLPERWQLVLWHLEVEGQKPADIAPLLGMSPNSVSALAYRAREGLRQAFLTMHLSDISESSCRWVNEHLGAYVRNGLSKRDSGKVQTHLDECRRCTAMYLELTEVNSNLSAIIAPLLLGGAAAAYLSSTGGLSASGLVALMGRARDIVAANATAATAGAVAVGVAAAAVVGITLATGKSKGPVSGADHPFGTVSTAPATPGTSAPTVRTPARTMGPAATAPASPAPTPAALLPSGTTPSTAQSSAATGGAPGQPTGSPNAQPSQQGSNSPSQGPTDNPSTSTPTPSSTGTPTGNPTVNVHVGVQVNDASASVTVSGEAGVPPTFDVQLTSEPGGITFKDTAGCPVVSRTDTTTVARCTNFGGLGGSARMPSSGTLAALAGPITTTLPFEFAPRQPNSVIQVSVSLPTGYADPDPSRDLTGTFPYTAPSAAVAMEGLDPTPATPDGKATPDDRGIYHLSGTVTGIPVSLDSITLESVGASFVDTPAGCTPGDDHHITCPRSGGSLPLTFALTPTGALPAPVSITALLPDNYVDTSALGMNDNTATATLYPRETPRPTADVHVTLPQTLNPMVDGTYDLVAVVQGIPTGYAGTVTYNVDNVDPGHTVRLAGSPTPGCTATGNALTCENASDGEVHFLLTAGDNTQATRITVTRAALEGYDDANGGIAQPITLLPVETKPTGGLSLSLPPTTHEDGNDPTADTFTLDATVAGLPDSVTSVTLTQNGAQRFAGGDGCAGGTSTVTCTVDGAGQVHPRVFYTGASRQDVTLTATTPDGFVDPTPEQPASATTTLEPEAAGALEATADLAMGGHNDGALTVTITGAATGKPLTLTLADKNGHTSGVKFPADAGKDCARVDDYTGTCPGGDSPLTVTVDVVVPPGLDAATVTVTDHAHDPAEATFRRADTAGHDAATPTAGAVSGAVPRATPAQQPVRQRLATLPRRPRLEHMTHVAHKAPHADRGRRQGTPRRIAKTIGAGIRSLLGPSAR